MSGLNRLEPGSDLSTDGGRGLLQETLDMFANTYRNLREELTKVKDSDKIVAPQPIEEFPTIMQVSPSQTGGAPLNSIVFSKTDATPAGYATCDGSNSTPDLRGRVPMGAGTGTGLTARAVGDVVGAETATADLANHTHTMKNHTHDRGNHAHNLAHTHDTTNPTSHVHNTTFYEVGGGATAGPAYGASGGTSHAVNTSGPSSNTTGAASTSVTSTDGSGNTTGPSDNTTDATGAGGGHANIQPSRVLKALMKTTSGDIDLPRVCPVFFGRVPARFDFEGQADITSASSADAFEVIETGQPPEKTAGLSLLGGAASGYSSCVLKFSVYIPYNFRKWKTAAVRLRTKLALTGVGGGEVATVTMRARKPTSTSAYLVGTSTRGLTESGGNLADSTWVDMVLKTTDLGDDWQPGYFLACEVLWSFPKTFSTASVKVGRLQINW